MKIIELDKLLPDIVYRAYDGTVEKAVELYTKRFGKEPAVVYVCGGFIYIPIEEK